MKIAFAYNLQRNNHQLKLNCQDEVEFDSIETIQTIKKTIEDLGHRVLMVEANLNAFEKLKKNKNKIDLVFNIAEGLNGDARESQIPLFCEILGIPYTHSSPTTHAIKLNKHLAKLLVKETGVTIPKSFLISGKVRKLPQKMRFPLIVKPNAEGSGKGITNQSIVNSFVKLNQYVSQLKKTMPGNIIAEEYIEGREFTVSVIGNPLRVLPIIEQKFDFLPKTMHRIAGYELKWIYEDKLTDLSLAYQCPAKISKKLAEQIEINTLKICQLLNVKDLARIDYRYSIDRKLYFLEINTLPGINPDEKIISYLPIAAKAAGLDYQSLIAEIIKSALSRY